MIKPIATNSFIIETGKTSLTVFETAEGQIEILPTQKFRVFEKIDVQVDHDAGKEVGLHSQCLDKITVDRIRILGLVLQKRERSSGE